MRITGIGSLRRDGGVALTAALLAVTLACAPAPRRPPNVVLVTFDALRQDHLSLNGYPRATSPTIDWLARNGEIHSAIVPTSCSTKASLTSLYTGLDYSAHRIIRHEAVLDAEFETLAETFRANGYATAAVVATPHVSAALGYDQGFDEYADFHSSRARYVTARVVGQQARAFLERATAGPRPFFLYVHFEEPHPPWFHRAPWRRGNLKRKRFFGAGCAFLPTKEQVDSVSEETRLDLVAGYDAAILAADGELRQLLDALRQRDQLARTVVAIGTDHGLELLDRYSATHGFNPFDEVLKTAWVIYDGRAPGQGKVYERQGRIFDLGPTLLAAAGLRAPAGLDGVDLRATDAPPRLAFSTCYGFEAVRSLQYKLVFYDHAEARKWFPETNRPLGQEDGVRLFDLRADPHERHDVGARNPELRDRLWAELVRYRARPRRLASAVVELPNAERDAEELARLRALGYID